MITAEVQVSEICLLTAGARQLEVLVVTTTDVILARDRDVIADSAHFTASAQLT